MSPDQLETAGAAPEGEAGSQGVTEFLVDEVRAIAAAPLPPEVAEVARHCALDWFGVTLAGAEEPLVHHLLAETDEQGATPRCTVVWHGARTSPAFAALINGSAADALDYSDTQLAMHGHPTAGVLATALAVGETKGATGAEILTALVAGIEMECRVGLMANPDLLETGYHPTGALAPFGCAAVAAYLMGLDAGQWAQALGIVATQAAGLKASGGTMCKPFHSGKAAMNGLLAASLARRGFVGRADAIEAPEGFLETHTLRRHDEAVFDSHGKFLILDTLVKRHAACQLTHSTIENMLALGRDHGVTADAVEHMELQVPMAHLKVCNIQEPVTGLETKFSLRAAAAMALLGDDMGDVGAYTDVRAKSPELCALRDRIEVTAWDDIEFSVAHAKVALKDGRELTVTSDTGEPIRDLVERRAVVARKFHTLVDPVLGAEAAARLEAQIMDLAALETAEPLFALSAKPAA